MKFKENLECTYVELFSWDYDKDGLRYPTSYELVFKFYGTTVTAHIEASELREDAEGVFCFAETDGELLTSFEEVFEDNDYFKDKVKEVCKKCWEDELDTNDYDYQGYEVSGRV